MFNICIFITILLISFITLSFSWKITNSFKKTRITTNKNVIPVYTNLNNHNLYHKKNNFILTMGIGDIFNKAFANEALPPARNPGLSKEPEIILIEFLPEKKVVKAIPGQKLSVVAQAAGIDIKYSCKRGDCGTCSINYNGSIVKTCQTIVPTTVKGNKITISPAPKKK